MPKRREGLEYWRVSHGLAFSLDQDYLDTVKIMIRLIP